LRRTDVVSEGDDHDGSDDDLPVSDNRSVFDSVHTEHGRLREIDDGLWTDGKRRKRDSIRDKTGRSEWTRERETEREGDQQHTVP
jgi:hypothetical protein